jgi:amino acid transporter
MNLCEPATKGGRRAVESRALSHPDSPTDIDSTASERIVVESKGLESGALGMFSSIAVGVASTAPAYSLAATLGFVVAVIGLQTPLLVVLAFIPMFLSAWATKQMNAADPDCGTSFTWAARAIGPKTGWFAGGWGTIAADFLAMASYAQVASQYVFLLIGATAIGNNPTSVWVLLLGIAWIAGLTWLCWRGIEISAKIQVSLVIVEVIILVLMAVVALVKVAAGSAPPGHIDPSWNWFNPLKLGSFDTFMQGMLLMVFIYWGWDTTTSINEETDEPGRIPGSAGVISTFLLLGTYVLVVIAVQAFAGVGTHGIGLDNPAHINDVLSGLGGAIFGSSTVGSILSHLLLFMVLTSAAATTQTTILPNARTTLSMAFHKALPKIFGEIHPRYKTPGFSTISFGVLSIVYYVVLNFVSGGSVIADAVDATVFFAALYLGITAIACAWHYREFVAGGFRRAVSYVWVPLAGGVALFVLLAYSFKIYWDPEESYFTINVLGITIGGTLVVVGIATIVGLLWMLWSMRTQPEFFSGESMALGVSITDDDDVVRIDTSPEHIDEP